MSEPGTGRPALIASGLAAIAASLCCLGPLLLVMLGLGGAWAASLVALEPFRPGFLGAAVVALFLAWKRIYRTSPCTPGSLCARPRQARLQRGLFWAVTVLVAVAFAFPHLAPLFY